MLELVGGSVDVWFGYFPPRLLGVLDRGKLFGTTTSEFEEWFCKIMLLLLAGGASGIASGSIRTRGNWFEISKPRYCAQVVQMLIGSEVRGVLAPL